ncbi:murein biosynthesis integral membrane protein MurJ [Helicobacter salomonis]|uniref:murein biosynthesis integral membrane protein MurJ n=1 Tax=Helicobacter salomonis TaxID=56878 RepID=UPI000CF0D30F|nr:murein biosynthesis integral membrane protein MurJ [Helicobacter salomonis]
MLKRFFLTNSSGILCSRIAGFVRDLLSASILGSGLYSDIFFVAFKFPNLFRRIFAEGAFSQSFLPAFIHSRHKAGFSLSVLGIFSAFLVIVSLAVYYNAPLFTKMFAYGFDAHTIMLAQDIVALNFWYLLLVFLSTFFGTLLQYKNSFFVSAYHTILLNIGMITGLLCGQDHHSLEVVYYLSYGVLWGGVAQVCVHFYPLYTLGFLKLFYLGFKHGFKRSKAPVNNNLKTELKGFFKQFFPSVLGNSASQLSAFLDTLLASFLSAGSISYLYYANRIFQLPLALFAIAISTALFPTIAKSLKNRQHTQAMQHMQSAFVFLTLTLLGSSLGGIVLSEFIIALLFEHGRFSAQDTIQSAAVFRMYLVGLLPFGLSKIFALWLYAQGQQLRAAKITLYSLIFGLLSSLVCMHYLQAAGLALASSLTGWMLCILNIKAFGFKRFLGMISLKQGIGLLGFLAFEALLLVLFLWCLQAFQTFYYFT